MTDRAVPYRGMEEYGGTATIEGEQGGREMMRPANR
jgi:hypothetical protein